MDLLSLILALSIIMWYVIDRLKPMWEAVSYSKYITMAIAALFGFGLSFSYTLDLVFALGFVDAVSVVGQILTALVLVGGSSAVSETIAAIKNLKT
jgi:hypothetical protein